MGPHNARSALPAGAAARFCDMTVPDIIYAIDSPAVARDTLRELAAHFRTRRHGPPAMLRTYYDTFDWRLYKDSGTLSAAEQNGSWVLRWSDLDGRMRHRATTESVPEFARDLGESPFRCDLARVTDIRRLLPVVRVESRGDTVSVLDRRDKTVTRVHFERGTAAGEASSPKRRMPHRIRVESLAGYGDAHASVIRFLGQRSGLARHEGGELSLALRAIGCRPAAYSSKMDLNFEPGLRADDAAKRILGKLLEIMQANDDGVRRDLDPEFLHDFRVAGRRTRSCLGQVKGVFGAELMRRFQEEFAWLGSLTGPTRDLDVYLLKFEGYRADLPESLWSDLDPLEQQLRQRQVTEHGRLSRELDSKRYKALIRDWSKFLRSTDHANDADAPNASRPVREVAAERIGRAYARVHKVGKGLAKDTPPELVHQLRIDCKKLRYLLEFFGGLFDREGVKSIVGLLKKLQDDLGDFNDLRVHQDELGVMAGNMMKNDQAGSGTLLAMGRLVEQLDSRQKRLTSRLLKNVKAFAGDKSRSELHKLVR